jgi:CRP/FNR family cyclic AMP-dependent transcriptional regulator
MTDSMLVRFEGDEGRRRLVGLLRTQILINGDAQIASEIAAVATLHEIAKADVLIRQDAADNDLFLILAGAVRIVVNGRDVAIRHQGQHVGEMAIVDPSAARSATVIAAERSLVAKISETDFVRLANANSYLWRMLALQLCRRLDERKRFHPEPNAKPVIFIGSSKEQLPVAEALRAAIPDNLADVVLWSKGVFEASNFVMETSTRSCGQPISPRSSQGPTTRLQVAASKPTRPAITSSSNLDCSWEHSLASEHFWLYPKGPQ